MIFTSELIRIAVTSLFLCSPLGTQNAAAAGNNLFVNGGFDQGFNGWAVSTTGDVSGPWEASGVSSTLFSEFAPFEGESAATHFFDGDDGATFTLGQEVIIPPDAAQAVLTWADRVQWNHRVGIPWREARLYEVTAVSANPGSSQTVLYEFAIPWNTFQGDTGYVEHRLDLLLLNPELRGQRVKLTWTQYVPYAKAGFAQFTLDNVRLFVSTTHEAPVTPQAGGSAQTMYVNTRWPGPSNGTFEEPYTTLAEAVDNVSIKGKIVLMSHTPETLTIDVPIDLQAFDRVVSIGRTPQ